MVICMASPSSAERGCSSSTSSSGRAESGELLAALAAVLRLFPEGSDRLKAVSAVLDAGAVPALVRAIGAFTSNLKAPAPPTTANSPEPPPVGPAPQCPQPRAPIISPFSGLCGTGGTAAGAGPGSTKAASATLHAAGESTGGAAGAGPCPSSDPSSAAWDAVSALEQLLLGGPKAAAPTAAKAARQALASGAVEALLPLLCASPRPSPSAPLSAQPGEEDAATWRVLRLLMVLDRSAAARCGAEGGEAEGRSGGGAASGVSAAGVAAVSGHGASDGGADSVVARALSAAQPAALDGLLHAAHDLLSAPHALTESTAEALLLTFTELLLSSGTATSATAEASATGAGALSPAQLRRDAPGLVAAALGILMGVSPEPGWAALAPCARERNLPSGAVTIRYPVQLEAAAAQLVAEVLGWALAAEGGEEEGGWRAWLPVAALGAALGQRWLERPGAFDALGDAGVRCLTLSLQLAPPGELWAGERISDIPRLARKVRSMLERHKLIAAWQLALVAALSAAAGSAARTPPAPTHLPPPPSPPPSDSTSSPDTEPQSQAIPAQIQIQTPVEQLSSPHATALELVTHLTSLVASVRLAKLAPAERIGIVAGALNVAVACVAPHRAVRHGAGARLLLPALCKMQLPAMEAAAATAAPSRAVAETGGAAGAESGVATQRQALLRAMSSVHTRLNLLLAAAMDPGAAAAAAVAGSGEADGGAGSADRGGGGGGADSEAGGVATGVVGDGGDSNLNGSFGDVELAEVVPTVHAALQVGAAAAAVVAECMVPAAGRGG